MLIVMLLLSQFIRKTNDNRDKLKPLGAVFKVFANPHLRPVHVVFLYFS